MPRNSKTFKPPEFSFDEWGHIARILEEQAIPMHQIDLMEYAIRIYRAFGLIATASAMEAEIERWKQERPPDERP